MDDPLTIKLDFLDQVCLIVRYDTGVRYESSAFGEMSIPMQETGILVPLQSARTSDSGLMAALDGLFVRHQSLYLKKLMTPIFQSIMTECGLGYLTVDEERHQDNGLGWINVRFNTSPPMLLNLAEGTAVLCWNNGPILGRSYPLF